MYWFRTGDPVGGVLLALLLLATAVGGWLLAGGIALLAELDWVERLLERGLEGQPPLGAGGVDHAHPGVRLQADDDLLVLVPAFTVSELTEAFMIGFLLFLPFLVIDMVVSNILLAMGMHMLSPVTVSMPFKLLLFVLIDGWDLLVRGLIQGYV